MSIHYMPVKEAVAPFDTERESARQPSSDPEPATANGMSPLSSISQLQEQANRLLEFIDELRTIADQACDSAVRHAESAQRTEIQNRAAIESLQQEIKQSNVALSVRTLALQQLEESSKQQIANLENRLNQNGSTIEQKQRELDEQRSRMQWVEDRAKQAAHDAQQRADAFQSEIANLKAQIANRDEIIQNKNATIRQIDEDKRKQQEDLQASLRLAQAQLSEKTNELAQREAVFQATAAKEAEIGRLIARLSTECDKLSGELIEKSRRIAQLESQIPTPGNDANIWRRVIGKLHDEAR